MTTLRQKKQATLAEAAGLTTPVDTSPKFTWIVSGNLGPYKQDEVLSTKEHIVKYWRMVINEGTDKETTLTDDQIWAAIQTINTEGLEPDDADMAAISYFDTLQSTREEPLDDKTRQKVLSESQLAAEAVMLGGLADKAFTASVQKALDGKQDWDGGPITIEAQLVRLYGDRMHDWPVIGTRKTGQTNRKGETRDNVSEGYNLPTDYFKVNIPNDGPKVIRWLNTFVEAMPHVHQLVTRRKTVVDLEKGTNLALIPQEYAQYVPPVAGAIDTPKLKGIADDLSAQITRNINRIGIAISFWQTKTAIEEKLGEKIGYELVDSTPEATAKRVKPIQMTAVNMQGKWMQSGRPISLSAFTRYGRFVQACKEQGGTLAKLIDLDKQSRKRKPLTPAVGAASSVVESKIENINAFQNVLSNVYSYSEGHNSMIKTTLADPRKAGELASWIKLTYETLQTWALDPSVNKLADAYDKAQRSAVAAAAEAEAKGKAA